MELATMAAEIVNPANNKHFYNPINRLPLWPTGGLIMVPFQPANTSELTNMQSLSYM